MNLASFAEMVTIGAVLPFLGALVAPEHIYEHDLMQSFIQLLKLTEPNQLLFPLTVLFIIVSIFAGAIRLSLLYVVTRFSYSVGADISVDIYRRTLYQEYAIHLERNSSEIINGIITKTNAVIGTMQAILTLISSIILIVGIMAALSIVDIKTSLIAFTGFGLLYWIVIYYTRDKIKVNSQEIAGKSTEIVKSLQEGLGGIRDVLIDGTQQFYCNLYRRADLSLRRAAGNNIFINSSPRYVMESIGMSLIAALAYSMISHKNGVNMVIPILGVLTLGAQRLLPALQQTYSSYSRIMGSRSSFKDVLNLLNQPLPRHEDRNQLTAIPFKKEIQVNNLSFRYTKDMPWILNNVNLTIAKGEVVGFMGETGSGKSTLLDVLMGLLLPTKGEIIVDGCPINEKNKKRWQLNIAHVPQSVYLSDSTIEENIAFGIPKDRICQKQVEKAAKNAKILESI